MIEKKVAKRIREWNMIQPGDHIMVGLSGGADSVCLLLLLHKLREEMAFSLEAMHVEHGIRGEESRQDARFAADLCKHLEVPQQTVSIDVPSYAKEHGLGLEEAARILRYEIFEKAAGEKKAKIALAHHMEDNAETILFQLARGSSLTGLCGMQPVRTSETGVVYIRPLLVLHREEIEEYLAEQGQPYCVDGTNMELEYSRNYLRNVILPAFSNINQQTVSHINETAEQLREVSDFLDQQIQASWKDVVIENRIGHTNKINTNKIEETILLDLSKIEKLHPALQKGLFYKAVSTIAGGKKDIASVHVEQVRGLLNKQSGKTVTLPNGMIAVRENDRIRFCPAYYRSRNMHTEKEKSDVETIAVTAGALREMLENGQTCRILLEKSLPEAVLEEALSGSNQEKESVLKAECAEACYFEISVRERESFADEIPRKTYTKWFDYDKIKDGFCIRKRQSGDYLMYDVSGHRKKLKQYFVDEKIPVTKRENIWILAQDHLVLWVVGGRISEHAKVTEATKFIMEITGYGVDSNEVTVKEEI